MWKPKWKPAQRRAHLRKLGPRKFRAPKPNAARQRIFELNIDVNKSQDEARANPECGVYE